jgi:two-component system response regulator ChvI
MPATLEQMTATSLSSAGPVVPFAHVGEPGTIRVLLVEDDQIYRDSLSNELSKHGFAVHGFADGASLLRALDSAIDADIIILDWGLPKTLGIDLLPQLRRHGVTLPVVFLSGRTMPANESLAFDRGAIDFIDKARGVEVLVRRLRRVVKASNRTEQLQTDRSMICGNLLLRPDVSRAYWKDTDLDLTLGENNIVHLLVSNVGKYITYRAVYDRLRHEGFIAGDGAEGYRANVRSAIKRIRNKFRALDPTFDEIENYAGFGYCWKKPD